MTSPTHAFHWGENQNWKGESELQCQIGQWQKEEWPRLLWKALAISGAISCTWGLSIWAKRTDGKHTLRSDCLWYLYNVGQWRVSQGPTGAWLTGNPGPIFIGVARPLRNTREEDFGARCLGLIEVDSWKDEGRHSGFPKKADHSPVMVGSGQGKERNSEKEFKANEGFKGQRTKLCKTRIQGEFQQRLEEVITDLEKGKEPWSPGSQESQVPGRNKETARTVASGVQGRRRL